MNCESCGLFKSFLFAKNSKYVVYVMFKQIFVQSFPFNYFINANYVVIDWNVVIPDRYVRLTKQS